ncbi:hypothetical protein BVRB_3g068130 [Beta vulgaris subsp. vulgaris]|nr:hypothetical protein BVRB_3g068130 [Beta vulgaris subsp. vulgaris]
MKNVEAERIYVDHVTHLKPTDGGSAATQLAAHLTGIHSAIKMLNSRVRVLLQYLVSMQKDVNPDTIVRLNPEHMRKQSPGTGL